LQTGHSLHTSTTNAARPGLMGNISVYSTKNVNYGLHDWSTLTGGRLTGTAIIVDCVSFQCSASGRRLGHNYGPITNAPITYPDSTLMASDPCDMTTVVRASLVAGKIPLVAYPWMSNCVYAALGVKKRTHRIPLFQTMGAIGLAVVTTVNKDGLAMFYATLVADYNDPNPCPTFPIAHFAFPTNIQQVIDAAARGDNFSFAVGVNTRNTIFPPKFTKTLRYTVVAIRSLALLLSLYYFVNLAKALRRDKLSYLVANLGSFLAVWFTVFCAAFGLWKESMGVAYSATDRATPPWFVFNFYFDPIIMVASNFIVMSSWVKVIINKRISKLMSFLLDLVFIVAGVAIFAYATNYLTTYTFSYKGETGSFAKNDNMFTNSVIDLAILISNLKIVSAGIFATGVLLLCGRLVQALRALKDQANSRLKFVFANTIVGSCGVIGANAYGYQQMKHFIDTQTFTYPQWNWASSIDALFKMPAAARFSISREPQLNIERTSTSYIPPQHHTFSNFSSFVKAQWIRVRSYCGGKACIPVDLVFLKVWGWQ